MFDDGDFRQFIGDKKQMREHGSVLAVQPMENLDRQFDFDSPRHVEKCSRRNQRFVQCGELGRAKNSGLRHEVFAEQIGVLDYRAFERLENDAALSQLIGNDVAFDELIARENQTGGNYIKPTRFFENRGAIFIGNPFAKFKWRGIEKIDTGKAPEL